MEGWPGGWCRKNRASLMCQTADVIVDALLVTWMILELVTLPQTPYCLPMTRCSIPYIEDPNLNLLTTGFPY